MGTGGDETAVDEQAAVGGDEASVLHVLGSASSALSAVYSKIHHVVAALSGCRRRARGHIALLPACHGGSLPAALVYKLFLVAGLQAWPRGPLQQDRAGLYAVSLFFGRRLNPRRVQGIAENHQLIEFIRVSHSCTLSLNFPHILS